VHALSDGMDFVAKAFIVRVCNGLHINGLRPGGEVIKLVAVQKIDQKHSSVCYGSYLHFLFFALQFFVLLLSDSFVVVLRSSKDRPRK